MDSSPTLHDFVLNLLCDSTARSAFELDPEGALQDAGLGDITAADVQEVIPLVVDYAPVDGIATLPVSDQLPADVPEVDIAGAVRQLQAVTQHLPAGTSYPTADLTTTVGAVTVGSGGLLADPLLSVPGLGGISGVPLGDPGAGLPGGLPGGLSVENDPAAGIDADLLSPVGGATSGVVAGTDQLVVDTAVGGAFGTLDVAVNTVSGGLLHPLNLDDGAILPATTSTVDSVVGGVDRTVDGVVNVDAPLHGVDSAATGVGGVVGGIGDTAGDVVGGVVGDDPTGVTDLLF